MPKRRKHERVAVGFFKDEDGETRPVTKSVGELNRKKVVKNPRTFKGVSPKNNRLQIRKVWSGTWGTNYFVEGYGRVDVYKPSPKGRRLVQFIDYERVDAYVYANSDKEAIPKAVKKLKLAAVGKPREFSPWTKSKAVPEYVKKWVRRIWNAVKYKVHRRKFTDDSVIRLEADGWHFHTPWGSWNQTEMRTGKTHEQRRHEKATKLSRKIVRETSFTIELPKSRQTLDILKTYREKPEADLARALELIWDEWSKTDEGKRFKRKARTLVAWVKRKHGEMVAHSVKGNLDELPAYVLRDRIKNKKTGKVPSGWPSW